MPSPSCLYRCRGYYDQQVSERRKSLADAGLRLVARDGVRALTHRAVDAEAGVPAGSTSYYARSRNELTALVVARISERLATALEAVAVPPVLDVEAATGIAEAFLETLAREHDAQAARLALLAELRPDDLLRTPLTAADPVRAALIATAEQVLDALGVSDAPAAALDFVGLVDALLLYRIAHVGPVDSRRVLTAYLGGLATR
jgi:DNA-binding transcriptional regulator YbjK